MGVSMGPRYYDQVIVPSSPYYYPQPRRIIVVNRPINGMMPVLPPQFVPIHPNQRVLISPHPIIMGPHGPMIIRKKEKKTIDNLADYIDEQSLTKDMLEKGEQKNCSICLEDFVVGDKIIYLPCFHYYHSKCIEKWMHNSDKCPLCNNEIKFT